MKLDESEISIYEVLKDRKFDASIITTYNVYFPFYEDVVLRRLSSSGARHNILLVDKKQLTECLNTPSLRPRRAGYEYTLIPMDFGGAFHPKIVILLERRKGMLFIGSHNMTISGFGVNRELTTKVDITAKDKSGVAEARRAYQSILTWLTTQRGIESHYVEAVQSLTQFAPWLKGKVEESKEDIQLFCTEPKGEPLWHDVRQALPKKLKRIWLLSPFFDTGLRFLSSIIAELQVAEIVIGIDPSSVDINKQKKIAGNIKFVDASKIYKKHGYLHAKAYLLEDHSGNSWFITGSANASAPAWLAEPSRRNIEAIVLHSGEKAINEAEKLGMFELQGFPEVSEVQWLEIESRHQKQKEREKKPIITQRTGTVLFEDNQLVFPSAVLNGETFKKASFHDGNHELLGVISRYTYVDGTVVLALKDSEIDATGMRFVQVECTNKQQYFFYVHHREHIERKQIGSHHAQFRASLASLSSENPDIERLITTVEKIIFENPPEIPTHLRKEVAKKAANTKDPNNEPQEQKEIESLAVHLKETPTEKRRIRLMRSGDLGHLLDVLIHHLGIGLEKSRAVIKDTTDHRGRSEEEQIGSDDEEQHEETKIDPKVIVRICHNKVRSLIGKMLKQLEKTATSEEADHVLPIVQLVAVLALLRELRLLDNRASWMPGGATLFPQKERERFLLGCVKFLHGPSFHLIETALQELTDEPKDEVSRLMGLLLWLVRDSGLDIRFRTVLGETPEQKRKKILNQYQMLCLAPYVSEDEVAIEEAKISILETTNPIKKSDAREWLQKHLMWGSHLSGYVKQFDSAKIAERAPRSGDLVFNTIVNNPVLCVVLRSSSSITNVVNLGKDNFEGGYTTSCLSVLDIPESVLTLN